jgi:hypothetical protein
MPMDEVSVATRTDRSETTAKLAAALNKFQAELTPVPKDATNPHFKANYATFDACVKHTRDGLAVCGLSWTQTFSADVLPPMVAVVTRLMFGAEWIESVLTFSGRTDKPQDMAAAASYARRIGFSAIIGLVSEEDDDGNAASGGKKKKGKDEEKPAGYKRPAEDTPGTPEYEAKNARRLKENRGRAAKEKEQGPKYDCDKCKDTGRRTEVIPERERTARNSPTTRSVVCDCAEGEKVAKAKAADKAEATAGKTSEKTAAKEMKARVITAAQRKRLFVVAEKAHGKDDKEPAIRYLCHLSGWSSTTEITKDGYDQFVETLKSMTGDELVEARKWLEASDEAAVNKAVGDE